MEIKYQGYSAVPSDYESADGQLASALGVIPEEGALKPLLSPKRISQGGQGLVYIHKNSGYEHWIYQGQNTLSWSNPDTQTQQFCNNITGIINYTSIGNTLVILTDQGVHYFLWNENNYKDLGIGLPEVSLSFGLQGGIEQGKKTDVSSNHSDALMGKCNAFIAEQTKAGKFIFPFFVRYALRLFDGSLVKHSAPILMQASSLYGHSGVQIGCSTVINGGNNPNQIESMTMIDCCAFGMVHDLDFSLLSDTSDFNNWKDIIRSVDVFVSAPIYNYNQNGEFPRDLTQLYYLNTLDVLREATSVCKHPSSSYYRSRTLEWSLNAQTLSIDFPHGMHIYFPAPHKNEEQMELAIKGASQFYFLKSYNLRELYSSSGRKKVQIPKDYLTSIVAREVLPDDYDTHDTLIPKFAYPYNQRLNMANITKACFDGFCANEMFEFTNGYFSESNEDYGEHSGVKAVSFYVQIAENGKSFWVHDQRNESKFTAVGKKHHPIYFFYPNIYAQKIVAAVTGSDNVTHYYESPLFQHDFLNGVYFFGDLFRYEALQEEAPPALPQTIEGKTIAYPNKLYTSEVNNPFYFPLPNINTVGIGEIRGISSAAEALSEGQFGQFPLYAFTNEGVWALEVSATGGYSSKQPITRDVVIGSESITQLDNAVLFATERGVMMLSGSNSQCISDILNSQKPFDITTLPKANVLVDLFNSQHSGTALTSADLQLDPFLTFIAGAMMMHDYIHQRVIVFNPEEDYAYVYSLKSQLWGMMHSNIRLALPSYPNALAVTREGYVVDFGQSDAVEEPFFIVTRPLALSNKDTFKQIDSIIQRGDFESPHTKQVLYGSNDLRHWQLVWSSVDKYLRGFHGTPYKAYRLAIIGKLKDNESLSGFTALYNDVMINQSR